MPWRHSPPRVLYQLSLRGLPQTGTGLLRTEASLLIQAFPRLLQASLNIGIMSYAPKGQPSDSPGQRPGNMCYIKTPALKGRQNVYLPPLQGFSFFLNAFPGRCPGLSDDAPSGRTPLFRRAAVVLLRNEPFVIIQPLSRLLPASLNMGIISRNFFLFLFLKFPITLFENKKENEEENERSFL